MIRTAYIAGPWKDRAACRAVRVKLEAAGIKCTSRWLDFVGDTDDPELLASEAQNDFLDVHKADALLLINSQKSEGKAVETGLAMAWEKPIFMVGEPSNVFHHSWQIKRFEFVDDAIEAMRKYNG